MGIYRNSILSCDINKKNINSFGLVSLFNDISIFVGYLMPRPPLEDSSGII